MFPWETLCSCSMQYHWCKEARVRVRPACNNHFFFNIMMILTSWYFHVRWWDVEQGTSLLPTQLVYVLCGSYVVHKRMILNELSDRFPLVCIHDFCRAWLALNTVNPKLLWWCQLAWSQWCLDVALLQSCFVNESKYTCHDSWCVKLDNLPIGRTSSIPKYDMSILSFLLCAALDQRSNSMKFTKKGQDKDTSPACHLPKKTCSVMVEYFRKFYT